MIRYTILTSEEKIVGFQVTGHAGFKKAGKDIVCAGVSVIAQMAARGLVDYLGEAIHWEQEAGKMVCQVEDQLSEENKIASQAILRSMQLGIEVMQKTYPKHVSVEFKEV